jgi:hypothetical protein
MGLNLIADEINNDGRFDLVIVDEANAYKTMTTKRWKTLKSIINAQHIPVDDDRYTRIAVTCRCVRLSQARQPRWCAQVLHCVARSGHAQDHDV